MNPENRTIKKEMASWGIIEKEDAKLFPSRISVSARLLRMLLYSMLIQKQYHYSERFFVNQDIPLV